MEIFPLMGIAFGLGVDAFSVAAASGVALGKVSHRQAFRLSFHFGLFQSMMPLLGWLFGSLVADPIRNFDHWVAFGLLVMVGGKMLWEASHSEDDSLRGDPTRGLSLIMLSVATSIDALAVGLSLALIQISVLLPSLVIGAVAANMTLLGLHVGKRAGHLLGRRMEVVGALVLIALGLKILLDHSAI